MVTLEKCVLVYAYKSIVYINNIEGHVSKKFEKR